MPGSSARLPRADGHVPSGYAANIRRATCTVGQDHGIINALEKRAEKLEREKLRKRPV